jgi:hypothetical protein
MKTVSLRASLFRKIARAKITKQILKDYVGRNLKTDGLSQKSILAFFKSDGSTLDFWQNAFKY